MAAELVRCEHCGRTNRVPAAAAGTPRCGNCHQPLPWIADAGDGTFAEIAEAAAIPVVVDLWAPWCAPCRMVSPALERLARDLAGRIKLVKVNIDESPQLAQRFDVHAVPTLLILRKGQVTARQAGALPLPALRAWAEHALAGVTAWPPGAPVRGAPRRRLSASSAFGNRSSPSSRICATPSRDAVVIRSHGPPPAGAAAF